MNCRLELRVYWGRLGDGEIALVASLPDGEITVNLYIKASA